MEYSQNFKKVLKNAELFSDGLINNNHLFMGLLSVKESRGYEILSKIIDINDATKKFDVITENVDLMDRKDKITKLSIDSENVLMQSQLEAKKFNSTLVRTEHLVLSMVRAKVINVVTYKEVEKLVEEINNKKDIVEMDKNTKKSSKSSKSNKTPLLDEFSTDLTKLAEEGKLDPIVGRKSELKRIAQVLSRRKKNNPVLIGDPGCVIGDTEIIIRKINNDTNHENIELNF